MPHLSKLKIQSFRNLRSVEIQPSEGINLIVGQNGSGKTSLLESISVLAHGRSFRTHKYRRLITHDETGFTVFGELGHGQSGVQQKLGITREARGVIRIRIDGKPTYTAAELAQQLPLLILNASSFQLLEGSSRHRRQFFDWLVFHVKHEYKNCWKDYSKCVKHRNSLLRSGKISAPELAPWDRELVQLAELIEAMRGDVFTQYREEFYRVLNTFEFTHDKSGDIGSKDSLTLSYHSGWKEGVSYSKQLIANLDRDTKLGYTSVGSHKADLKISLGKVPAVELLSRGQQKSVITALFLAEANVFHTLTGRKPVILLDDLPAELDAENLQTVGEAIRRLSTQVFVTAIEPEMITDCWHLPTIDTLKMFHVEHGKVQVTT
ncbi:DNA replication/repair protein RecF [Teredinibacter purpureus]|uniref:DNA replication/repair protein RecF n=1 Tax=Teredinibacter purpureus TaxID=2731756 RepID=UPI0005F88166|nr:DNA replication/repair protein RecF [Teredinibacter purpureus]